MSFAPHPPYGPRPEMLPSDRPNRRVRVPSSFPPPRSNLGELMPDNSRTSSAQSSRSEWGSQGSVTNVTSRPSTAQSSNAEWLSELGNLTDISSRPSTAQSMGPMPGSSRYYPNPGAQGSARSSTTYLDPTQSSEHTYDSVSARDIQFSQAEESSQRTIPWAIRGDNVLLPMRHPEEITGALGEAYVLMVNSLSSVLQYAFIGALMLAVLVGYVLLVT